MTMQTGGSLLLTSTSSATIESMTTTQGALARLFAHTANTDDYPERDADQAIVVETVNAVLLGVTMAEQALVDAGLPAVEGSMTLASRIATLTAQRDGARRAAQVMAREQVTVAGADEPPLN
jgi:hypothetical protein